MGIVSFKLSFYVIAVGCECGTEDDDQSTVVPESSKGEYNSSETPPAVSKEPIPVRTEYPIDVAKNSHQALLDTISNDSEVVRVWMPLLRRLRPPLPERELEIIRKSSTGSQAKASQALNKWARITQGVFSFQENFNRMSHCCSWDVSHVFKHRR